MCCWLGTTISFELTLNNDLSAIKDLCLGVRRCLGALIIRAIFINNIERCVAYYKWLHFPLVIQIGSSSEVMLDQLIYLVLEA